MIPYKAYLCRSRFRIILLMDVSPMEVNRPMETYLDSLLVLDGLILRRDCGILRRVNKGAEMSLRLLIVMGVGEYISPAERTLAS